MSELKSVSRFSWLLAWLANSVDHEEVHKLQESLAKLDVDTGDGALGIFDALTRQNRIHDEDTGFLRALFINLGRPDLLEAIELYDKEKGAVAKILNKNSSVFGGPFFGSQSILDQITKVLDTDYDHIHALCISGEPGIGKTRMAQEACTRMHASHKLISVDLRGLMSVHSVYFAVMHAFGVETAEYNLEQLYGFLRDYETSAPDGNTVLLLDNADSMLNSGSAAQPNPSFRPFTDALRTITAIPNPRLKIMLISSHHLDMKAKLSRKVVNGFRLQQHNGLDSDDVIRMFGYHAGNTPISRDLADDVASLCGSNPMAIKITASRLQDGTSQLQDVIPEPSQKEDVVDNLSSLQISQTSHLNRCLRLSFDSLSKTQRLNVIKLASFPGHFSLDAARKVLKSSKKGAGKLRLELQDLKYFGLLEEKLVEHSEQFSGKVPMYSMHVGIRNFAIEYAQSRPGNYLKVVQKAHKRHFQFYGKKLRKISKKVEGDTCSALVRLREDQANYIGFLDTLRITDGFRPCDNLWVLVATDLLLSPDEGQRLFGSMADQAKEEADHYAFADLKLHQIKHLKDLTNNPEDLLHQLTEIHDILDQNSNAVDVKSKHVNLATLYCIRGELLVKINKTSEAMLLLKKAENLQKQLSSAKASHRFLAERAVRSLQESMKATPTAPKTFVVQVAESKQTLKAKKEIAARIVPEDESSSSCSSALEGRLVTRRKSPKQVQSSSEDESSSSCSDTMEVRLPGKKKLKTVKPEPVEDGSSSSCSSDLEAKLPPRKKIIRPKQDPEDKPALKKFQGRSDKNSNRLNIHDESSAKKRTASGGSADSAVDSGSVHSSDEIANKDPQSQAYHY